MEHKNCIVSWEKVANIATTTKNYIISTSSDLFSPLAISLYKYQWHKLFVISRTWHSHHPCRQYEPSEPQIGTSPGHDKDPASDPLDDSMSNCVIITYDVITDYM